MNEQSAWRLAFARRYLEPYREHPAARMGVLGGSVAQGVADRWSDCDTLVDWDSIDAEWLETPRAGMPAAGGERFTWLESYPGNAWLEQVRPELDDLVERTLALVEEHLSEVDTSRARAVWSLPAEPCEAALW